MHTKDGRYALTRIAGIVLAAGSSTRFGQPKQLVEWQGVPFIVRTVATAARAGLAPIVVVLGSHAEAVRGALERAGLGSVLCWAMNWRWGEGIASSVQVGLMALPPDCDGAIFMHCDQPLLPPDLLRGLVRRFEESGKPIVHPGHDGRRLPPALFGRALFAELAALRGDVGGRAVIERHAGEVAVLPIADPLALSDVDTVEDLERLQRLAAAASPATSASANVLSRCRYLICDMDGVLWQGNEPLPGLGQLFEFLRQHEIGYVLATNNSSRTPEQYVAKLAGFGIEVQPEHILTSSQVAAAYLASIAPAGTPVYAIGEDGLRQALTERGFLLAEGDARYVVVGWDRQLTWEKLATATLLIHRGAGFIGTNPDYNYPTERGPAPGNGAQLAALETATRVPPVVVGKPQPEMYREALRRMGAPAEATVVVGDRLDTDIAGGVPLGLTTVLLLSGIATEAMLAASPIQPDLVLRGLPDLVQAWRAALESACEQGASA
jgi:4-nitrophenyl phosphatase